MEFSEIANWIEEKLIVNRNLSLNRVSKGVKIFEISLNNTEVNCGKELSLFLVKSIRLIDKKSRNNVRWFKINIIDNAISRLVGLGEIENRNDLSLVVDLLMKDTASQRGETIIGLFNENRDWVLKITNNQDESRVTAKIYGESRIIEKLKESYR